jgi:hypothetical protein
MKLHWVPITIGFSLRDEFGTEIGRIVDHGTFWEWWETRKKYWDAGNKRWRNVSREDAFGYVEPTMALAAYECMKWLSIHEPHN